MKAAKAVLVTTVGIVLILTADVFAHRAMAVLLLILYLPAVALVETVVQSVVA